MRRRRRRRCAARTDRQGVRRSEARTCADARVDCRLAGLRQAHDRPLQISACDRISAEPSAQRSRKAAAISAAQPFDTDLTGAYSSRRESQAKESRMQVLQPPKWAPPKGYANGTAARGTLVFVGGQVGWNAEQRFETDDFVAQCRQALRNVVTVL